LQNNSGFAHVELEMTPLAEESLTRPKFVCKMLSLLFRHLRGSPVVPLTSVEFQCFKVRHTQLWVVSTAQHIIAQGSAQKKKSADR
jgi:hypothetical protein